MNISQRIFMTLEEKGLKQKDLAEYIGVSNSSVSDWKNKNSIPTADKILKISEFLNVSAYYILSGEELQPVQNINNNNYSKIKAVQNNSVPEMNGIQKEMLEAMEQLPKSKQLKALEEVYKMIENNKE